MLDTIVLKLTRDDFVVTDFDRFTPSARNLFCPPYAVLNGKGAFRCTQNPTKADLREGIYKPRLTIIKGTIAGGYTLDIRIEFSAPKLLFGNNFDELGAEDFEEVLAILNQRLHEMGVKVQPEALRKASVSAVHFSKNIVLKNHATSSAVIGELAKLDFNSRLDLNKTTFRNGGYAVSYHANSYEVVFYDKIKELEQARISEKRTMEGKGSLLCCFMKSGALPRGLEVLRIEVRLGKRKKVANLFKRLGICSSISFDGIFNRGVAQKVLLYFWDNVEHDIDFVQMSATHPEDAFLAIQQDGQFKANKVLQHIGALSLIQSVGMRGLRTLMDRDKARSWTRLRKELESLPKPHSEMLNTIKQIRNCLVDFSPLKLDSCHAAR